MQQILFLISLFLLVFFTLFFVLSKRKTSYSFPRFKILNINSFRKLCQLRAQYLTTAVIFLSVIIFSQNIIFAMIFSFLYIFFDRVRKNKRAKVMDKQMDKQVLEILNIIKNAIQAGQNLTSALDIVREETGEPLKLEFTNISEKLSLGISLEQVLIETAHKAKNKEFKFMLNTLLISKETGASLGVIFERIIDTASQRIYLRQKINTLTAQGRMSGNIVSIIPFIVIAITYLIEPQIIGVLFTTFAGNVLLLLIVLMTAAGLFIIRKITEIEL
jgi:tight adherence protein B